MIGVKEFFYTGRPNNMSGIESLANNILRGKYKISKEFLMHPGTRPIQTLRNYVDNIMRMYVQYKDKNNKLRWAPRHYICRKYPDLLATDTLIEAKELAKNWDKGGPTLSAIQSELSKRQKTDYKPYIISKLKWACDVWNNEVLNEMKNYNIPITKNIIDAIEKHKKECALAGLPEPKYSYKIEITELTPKQKLLVNYKNYLNKVKSELWDKVTEKISKNEQMGIVDTNAYARRNYILECLSIIEPIINRAIAGESIPVDKLQNARDKWIDMIKRTIEYFKLDITLPEEPYYLLEQALDVKLGKKLEKDEYNTLKQKIQTLNNEIEELKKQLIKINSQISLIERKIYIAR